MKEIVTSWILLAGMAILFFINSYTISRVTKTLCKDIETLEKILEKEDRPQAEKTINKIRLKWQKECKKLIHIFSHTQLEDIDMIIISTQRYILNNEFNSAYVKLSEARYRITLLEENEKLTLDNIF